MSQTIDQILEKREIETLARIKRDGSINDLSRQAETYALDLGMLHHKLRAKKGITKYEIEDYWEREKVGEFNEFLDNIHYGDQDDSRVYLCNVATDPALELEGVKVPERRTPESSIKNAAFSGIMYNGKESIYVFSGRSFIDGLTEMAPVAMLLGASPFLGSLVLSGGNDLPSWIGKACAITGGIGGILGAQYAAMYTASGAKNPLIALASGIKEKVRTLEYKIEKSSGVDLESPMHRSLKLFSTSDVQTF